MGPPRAPRRAATRTALAWARRRAAAHKPARAVRCGLAAARTLRWWVAVRSRRRRTDLWSAHRRLAPALEPARLAVPAGRAAAVATFVAVRAVVAPVAAVPTAAAARNHPAALAAARRRALAVERRKALGGERRKVHQGVARRSLAAARRWRRTGSVPRANQPENAAAQLAQSLARAAADPTQRAAVRLPAAAAGTVAGPTATGRAAAARAAAVAARSEPVAAHPTALPGAHLAADPQERAGRSARPDPAEPEPGLPRRAPLLLRARRKTGKTCWWADSLRHTACRRS